MSTLIEQDVSANDIEEPSSHISEVERNMALFKNNTLESLCDASTDDEFAIASSVGGDEMELVDGRAWKDVANRLASALAENRIEEREDAGDTDETESELDEEIRVAELSDVLSRFNRVFVDALEEDEWSMW